MLSVLENNHMILYVFPGLPKAEDAVKKMALLLHAGMICQRS